MEPERVQALRDTKALYDEGILDEAEYKAKKKELLAAPPAKALDDCAFVAPKKTEQIFEPSTDFESGGFREGTTLITTKDVESDFNDPAVSWLVVEEISDEALLACVRTRFVGGRESGNRLAVFDCLASSKTSGDAGAAALNTAESAARAHGCCACNVEVPTPRVSDRTTLEKAGYAAVGPALKLPGSSTTYATLQKKLGEAPPPPPPPKRKLGVASSSQQFVAAPSPPVEAQLELCSALQGLGKLLDGGDDTKTKKNPADAKLEGLVGDLIGALKTDAGKRDFERLAAAQNSEEDLAAKSPFPGFVPRPPGERRSFSGRGPASVEVNEPRAFVELLASDSRFTR